VPLLKVWLSFGLLLFLNSFQAYAVQTEATESDLNRIYLSAVVDPESAVQRLEAGLKQVMEIQNKDRRKLWELNFRKSLAEFKQRDALTALKGRKLSDLAVEERDRVSNLLDATETELSTLLALAPELDIATIQSRIGVMRTYRGDHEGAEKRFLQALELFIQHPEQNSHDAGKTLHNYAVVQKTLGRNDKAKRLLEQSRALWTGWYDPNQIREQSEKHLATVHRILNGIDGELKYYRSLRADFSGTFSRVDLVLDALLDENANWPENSKLELLGLLAEGILPAKPLGPWEDKLTQLTAIDFYRPAILELRKLRDTNAAGSGDFPWWTSADKLWTGTAPPARLPSRGFQRALILKAETLYNLYKLSSDGPEQKKLLKGHHDYIHLAMSLFERNLDPDLLRHLAFFDMPEADQKAALDTLLAKFDWDSNAGVYDVQTLHRSLFFVAVMAQRLGREDLRLEYSQRFFDLYWLKLRNLPKQDWSYNPPPATYPWRIGREHGALLRKLGRSEDAVAFELKLSQFYVDDGQLSEATDFINGNERYESEESSRFPELSEAETEAVLGRDAAQSLRNLKKSLEGAKDAAIEKRFIDRELAVPTSELPNLKAVLLKGDDALTPLELEQIQTALKANLNHLKSFIENFESLQRTHPKQHEAQRFRRLSEDSPLVTGIGFDECAAKVTVYLERNGRTTRRLVRLSGLPELDDCKWSAANLQLVRF